MKIYDVSGNPLYNNIGMPIGDADTNCSTTVEAITESNANYANHNFMRIVMLDNNYKYFSVANIKLIIDQMNLSGLNYLMLGFGGSGRGLGFKLNNMTIEADGIEYDLTQCVLTNYGAYLSENDMQTIISYALAKNIEIIPLFNMPGHFRPFLKYQPQFRYNNDIDSLDIDNPKAVNYAIAVAELYMKWFSAHGIKWWNLGADEFADISNGYYTLFSNGNYNYANFINRVAYMAAKYRMIPMTWNDPICVSNSHYPFIVRNAPTLYWHKGTNWGTTNAIKADGHKLINSSEDIYWVANGPQVTETQMRNFNIKRFDDGSTINDPAGACFCIWIGTRESPALNDDGTAITQAVLPIIAAFGETIASQIN